MALSPPTEIQIEKIAEKFGVSTQVALAKFKKVTRDITFNKTLQAVKHILASAPSTARVKKTKY